MKENIINIITRADDTVSNTVSEYLLGKNTFNRINSNDFYPITFDIKSINKDQKTWNRRGSINTIPNRIDDDQLLIF
jgi:uncharacterized lipoprotein YddW (UPF0748 family)